MHLLHHLAETHVGRYLRHIPPELFLEVIPPVPGALLSVNPRLKLDRDENYRKHKWIGG
jgi:hypothetical protein